MITLRNKSPESSWCPLDTVARMYPALQGSGSPASYRISIVLNQPIKPHALKNAVSDTISSFPYFRSSLKSGLFWHFMEQTRHAPLVIKDSGHPCRDFNTSKEEKLLLRVLYSDFRISLECSHILTDGYGALEFLRCLVEHYLLSVGIIRESILSTGVFSGTEYMEDAYRKYFIKEIPHAEQLGKTFQLGAPNLPDRQLRIIYGEVDAGALIRTARQTDSTITQYLAAVYLWSIYCLSKKTRFRPVKSIRLFIPVNLRRLYPSKTLRNFFAPVLCQILPFLGDYTFDEVLEDLKIQMAWEFKPRFINLQIARNVSLTFNFFIRLVPLALKIPVLRYIYLHQAMRAASGLISNLGRVTLADAITKHCEKFEFITSPSNVLKTTAGVIGFKDKIVITFCNTTADTSVEREFFTFLSKQKIGTKIYANYQSGR